MGLFIGFVSVFLILFLIAAMAVAEWADKDIVDLIAQWVGVKKSQPAAAAVTAAKTAMVRQPAKAKAQTVKTALSPKKPKPRLATGKAKGSKGKSPKK